MGLVDFILNLAGLLLWLSWLSIPFDPLARAVPSTLPGTLRRAAPMRWKHWHFLASLGILLFVRAFFYWKIGGAVGWTARLNLIATSIPFQSDFFRRMFVFSLLSFALTLALFYLWLLFFAVVNNNTNDLMQKFARQLLGRPGRWPLWTLPFLPIIVAILAWLVLNPFLAWMNILPGSPLTTRVEQGTVLGFSSFLSWKYLIGTVLALHIVNSYIFLGNHAVWDFVNLTSRRLMRPLKKLPLEIGKVDFTPIIVIVIVFLTAEGATRGAVALYSHLSR
ncbi:MAG TPA: hypothetical protein VH255_10435 [Verrucomicrobiae bacterium]|nr:hypothetical protein [Verrucomicrobiae bacterium]